MNVDIRPIPVPASLGTPDSVEFEAFAAFAEALEVEVHGNDEISFGADELLVFYGDERYRMRRAFGAWDSDRLVGVASVLWELDSDATTAFSTILGVSPKLRRRGIGSRLLAELERTAHDAGRPNARAARRPPHRRRRAGGHAASRSAGRREHRRRRAGRPLRAGPRVHARPTRPDERDAGHGPSWRSSASASRGTRRPRPAIGS